LFLFLVFFHFLFFFFVFLAVTLFRIRRYYEMTVYFPETSGYSVSCSCVITMQDVRAVGGTKPWNSCRARLPQPITLRHNISRASQFVLTLTICTNRTKQALNRGYVCPYSCFMP
jgi:hypothetical protein